MLRATRFAKDFGYLMGCLVGMCLYAMPASALIDLDVKDDSECLDAAQLRVELDKGLPQETVQEIDKVRVQIEQGGNKFQFQVLLRLKYDGSWYEETSRFSTSECEKANSLNYLLLSGLAEKARLSREDFGDKRPGLNFVKTISMGGGLGFDVDSNARANGLLKVGLSIGRDLYPGEVINVDRRVRLELIALPMTAIEVPHGLNNAQIGIIRNQTLGLNFGVEWVREQVRIAPYATFALNLSQHVDFEAEGNSQGYVFGLGAAVEWKLHKSIWAGFDLRSHLRYPVYEIEGISETYNHPIFLPNAVISAFF